LVRLLRNKRANPVRVDRGQSCLSYADGSENTGGRRPFARHLAATELVIEYLVVLSFYYIYCLKE